MSEKMSVCPYCKKNNAIDAKFCSYCGKQFTSNVETADTNTSFSNDVTDNNSQKTENGVSLYLLFFYQSFALPSSAIRPVHYFKTDFPIAPDLSLDYIYYIKTAAEKSTAVEVNHEQAPDSCSHQIAKNNGI